MRVRSIVKFIISGLIGLTFSSCDERSDVEVANEERIFICGNSTEPQGIDPHMVTGVPESNIIGALFEGLCGNHPSSDTIITPGVAETWESNEDATEWVFKLRKDAKWSDGTALVAEDFIFSFERMLLPEMAAAYAEMLYFIDGAEAFNKTQLGRILCGNDPEFPVPWEKLEQVNFTGDSELEVEKIEEKEKDDEALTKDEQKKLNLSMGLDKLSEEDLRAVKNAPNELFEFPEWLTDENRNLILDRLIGYHTSGKPPLWGQAKVGVRAPDPHTLVIKCKESVPYLPSVTRHYTWFPVPPHVIMRYGEGETREAKMTFQGSRWTTVEGFVGNGPFTLKEWKFNSYILTEKSETYWDKDNVWLNGVKFLPIGNPYTEFRAFLNGQLHTTYSLPNELIDRVSEENPQWLRQEPYVGSLFMRINVERGVLENAKVRQALNLAVDRERLTKYLLLGYTPATSVTPPLGDYVPPKILEFDPERAKALLKEAGYENGQGLGPIKILATDKEGSKTMCEALQAMWKDTLGIEVQVSNQEWASYLTSMQEMDYDISLGGWIGDYLDPTTFLMMWIKDGGNNNTGWSSEKFEATLDRAGHEPDAAKRLDILREAETIFMEDYAVIPIGWYARNYLQRPAVEGWYPLALDNHPYKTITLDPQNRD